MESLEFICHRIPLLHNAETIRTLTQSEQCFPRRTEYQFRPPGVSLTGSELLSSVYIKHLKDIFYDSSHGPTCDDVCNCSVIDSPK